MSAVRSLRSSRLPSLSAARNISRERRLRRNNRNTILMTQKLSPGQWLLIAPFRQYFRRRKNRRNRRNYIFFGSILSQDIMVFDVALLHFLLSESKWHIWNPIWGWFGSTWSISAGRGLLKSCYGVKLCLMLAENAVLCQRNYDGFLCYFFYLIITISFQINIQSFVDFQPWIKPRNASVGWGEPKLSQNSRVLKIQSSGLGPLSADTWKSLNAQEMSEIYFSRHIDQTANLLADTL